MEKQVRVSVRMPVGYAEALERKAAEEERTVSAEIRRLIRRHIEESKHKGARMA